MEIKGTKTSLQLPAGVSDLSATTGVCLPMPQEADAPASGS